MSIEFSNDAFNGKTKFSTDEYFTERKPITQKGLKIGDFVSFKDKTLPKYGILCSLKNDGNIDWVDFTNSVGESTGFSDLAIKFDGSFKRIEPKIVGLKVRCRSCDEDEIEGIILEDSEKNLVFCSNFQNELLDDIEEQGYKYSCVLLSPEEREEMARFSFGRTGRALSFIREKNFNYRFITVK